MDFNPDTWGTVADWVGGLGTTAAFIAAVVVIAKDAKVRKIAQASKVIYYQEPVKGSNYDAPIPNHYLYIVKNLSDEPIYSPAYYDPRAPGVSFGPRREVLLPGKDMDLGNTDYKRFDGPRVVFTDNAGRIWNRDISGHLREGGGPVDLGKKRRPPKAESRIKKWLAR